MNKSFRFRGLMHEMASDKILGFIDPGKLAEIRQGDEHPMFRAYSIGHEGESTGSLVGIGTVVKRWVRAMVQELSDKIKIGTKVFLGHGKDNTHEGRTVIGELVGKTVETIKDKLHTIGILYIKKEHRDMKLDISSIEADAEFKLTGSGSVLNADVVKINDIPGIALANSMYATPGFSGATLHAQIQEYTTKESKMTIDEVKGIIKQEGFIPSELFGKDELILDPLITEIGRERNKNEYQARKRNQEEFSGIEDDYKKTISGLEDSVKSEKIARMKVEAIDMVKKEMDNGRKLDDKQKKFIMLDFEQKFNITDPENLKAAIGEHIDLQVAEWKKNMEIMGNVEEPDIDGDGISEPVTKLSSGTDYTSPENNDFIPK